MSTVKLVVDARAEVGEGPSWDAVKQLLYWVDITGKIVHVYDPLNNQDRKIQLDQYVGAVVPRKSGGVVLAMGLGFYHLDLETEEVTLLSSVETNRPNIRFNDGKVDPYGRFWVGTMELDGEFGAGSLYVLDKNLTVREMISGVTISNGLAWSPDSTQMYYIDSPTRQICAYDYAMETGFIENKRVVVEMPDRESNPDGMTIDEEGMLWVAQWGAGQVIRYNPDTGSSLEKIALPVQQISSCAFGGKDLDELYITTARYRLSPYELNSYPLSGGLFSVKTKVKGLPIVAFGG